MAKWRKLDPLQQNDLLGDITQMIVEALPPGWRELAIDYRELGDNIDIAVGVLDPNGTYQAWEPPTRPLQLFQKLRGGMYEENEGTWYSARYKIEPPSRFSIQYNWQNEPNFSRPISPEDVLADKAEYPRDDAHTPPWFRQRLEAAARG